MSRKRAADRPTDWLSERYTTHGAGVKIHLKISRSGRKRERYTVTTDGKERTATRKEFCAALMAASREADGARFLEALSEKAASVRQRLELRGWRIAHGGGGITRPVWLKAGPPQRCSDHEADSTAQEKALFDVHDQSIAALHHAELGQWNGAMQHAFCAGRAEGLYVARVRQAEQKSAARKKTAGAMIKQEAMQRLRALDTAGDKLAAFRPARIARLDPWFAELSKPMLRDYLREFRRS